MPTPFFEMPKASAFRQIVTELLDHMRLTMNQLLAGENEEALHDFRVALRKLRVWLKYVGPLVHGEITHKTVEILRHITQITNEARDTEVQIELYRLLNKQSMVEVAQIALEQNHRQMCEMLQKRFVFVERAIEAALSSSEIPSEQVWREDYSAAIEYVMKRLHKRLSAWRSIDDAESLHRARITIKELRYLLEPVQGQIPALGVLSAHLRHLQNALGDVRDMYVALHTKPTPHLSGVELAQLREQLEQRYRESAQIVLNEVRQFQSTFYGKGKTMRLFPTLVLDPHYKHKRKHHDSDRQSN